MTWGGWLSMGLSVTFVTTLFLWCCWRIGADQPETDVQDDE